MTKEDAVEILCKQMELLAEESQNSGDEFSLPNLTEAMAMIFDRLYSSAETTSAPEQ